MGPRNLLMHQPSHCSLIRAGPKSAVLEGKKERKQRGWGGSYVLAEDARLRVHHMLSMTNFSSVLRRFFQIESSGSNTNASGHLTFLGYVALVIDDGEMESMGGTAVLWVMDTMCDLFRTREYHLFMT